MAICERGFALVIRQTGLVAACWLPACGPSMDDNIELLAHGGDEGDKAAVAILVRGERAVEPLLAALDDHSYADSHVGIVDLLFRLTTLFKDERVISALSPHIASHPDPSVRVRIVHLASIYRRVEMVDEVMGALRDTAIEVQHQAFRTLNDLENHLAAEQVQVLDEFAADMLDSSHEGIKQEARSRIEVRVSQMMVEAEKLVVLGQVEEAERVHDEALAFAPHSWEAKYRLARFLMQNVRFEEGLERMRRMDTVLDVPQLKEAPAIDGRLDEAVWREAGKARLNYRGYRSSPMPAHIEGEVYAGYTAEGLFLGFVNYDDAIDSLSAVRTERDGQVFVDESVEIFLDANLDRRSYAQIVFNAIGAIFDGVHEAGVASQDPDWNAAVNVGTHTGADFWSVECRLPYDSRWVPRPKPGDVWGGNFARNFRDQSHTTQWVYTYMDFHKANGFGVLVFN